MSGHDNSGNSNFSINNRQIDISRESPVMEKLNYDLNYTDAKTTESGRGLLTGDVWPYFEADNRYIVNLSRLDCPIL